METENLIQQIQIALSPVAEKIGQGAQYGWEIVVRQQYVTAYFGVFWAVVGLIVSVIFALLIPYLWKGQGEYNKSDIVLLLVPLVLGIYALMTGLYTAITHFLNPDYYALQFFIDLVCR